MPTEPRANGDGLETVFDARTIAGRVVELGREIDQFYGDGELLVIGLLKGSFIFLADLVRCIERPHTVDFLVAGSYGEGTVSSGSVRLAYQPDTTLAGRRVLLVEDVVDTGNTLNHVCRLIRKEGPVSLDVCALLHKQLAESLEVPPRFVGFDAPPEFLVGYGLDHAERYRHLPVIAKFKGPPPPSLEIGRTGGLKE